MKKVVLPIVVLSLLITSFTSLPSASAHNECERGDIRVVGGWVSEPPLVGQLNGIELEITRISSDQAIANALAQLEVTVKKGTLTKALEFLPTEEPGTYDAEILPTQTGQYAVVMTGTVAGQAYDCQVEIEDVEDTRQIEFPPATGNGGNPIPPDFLQQFQEAIADLSGQIDTAVTSSEEAKEAALAATESASELKSAADRAYLFGMAGIVIGVVALSRSRERA
jgi:hypothetical protein